jgi:hypothetical protein
MNYSPIHSKLSETHPDVLNDPEKYLGLNCATILNFWWFVDGLNSEQAHLLQKIYNYTVWDTIRDRYIRLNGLNTQLAQIYCGMLLTCVQIKSFLKCAGLSFYWLG